MQDSASGASRIAERRASWVESAQAGPLSAYLRSGPVLEVADTSPTAEEGSQGTVLALFRLQGVADYRAALRAWLRPVRVGGHLIVVVPHAFLHERQLALPSRWEPRPRRLYTPRSLMEEVEEALPPNSYRVRHLGDLDAGYDYTLGEHEVPVGESDVVLVLERIAPPAWTPALLPIEATHEARPSTPDFHFETSRTRVEAAALFRPRRVLILKLDHLGDMIMATAALERARAVFADAEITLVVGSWNLDVARGLGVADQVIPFDAFPPNSAEEEVDVAGKRAVFQATITGEYDLAIDLRADYDTRPLLRLVKAELRAGIGTRGQFPYLDIFLPADASRGEWETARQDLMMAHEFASHPILERRPHRLVARVLPPGSQQAMIWGPYWPLRPGRYLFEPHIEFTRSAGQMMVDVALDEVRTANAIVDLPATIRIPFTVGAEGGRFEFRVWTVAEMPGLAFSFFGGRLLREGAGGELHQSEYMLLLIELVAIRLARNGVLREMSTVPVARPHQAAATA